mgnify:FL=1
MSYIDGFVIAVPPQYTSQTCPCCGHVSKDNRQTQARFECIECGFEENADVVGAINILARGHRVLACGEPVQLEPLTKRSLSLCSQRLNLVNLCAVFLCRGNG